MGFGVNLSFESADECGQVGRFRGVAPATNGGPAVR